MAKAVFGFQTGAVHAFVDGKGRPWVAVTGWIDDGGSQQDRPLRSDMTAGDARRLAAQLLEAADKAEGQMKILRVQTAEDENVHACAETSTHTLCGRKATFPVGHTAELSCPACIAHLPLADARTVDVEPMSSRDPVFVEAYGYEFQYDDRPGDGSGEIVENVGRPGEIAVGYFFHDDSGATGNPPGIYVRTSEMDEWRWTADHNSAAAYVCGFLTALLRGV